MLGQVGQISIVNTEQEIKLLLFYSIKRNVRERVFKYRTIYGPRLDRSPCDRECSFGTPPCTSLDPPTVIERDHLANSPLTLRYADGVILEQPLNIDIGKGL